MDSNQSRDSGGKVRELILRLKHAHKIKAKSYQRALNISIICFSLVISIGATSFTMSTAVLLREADAGDCGNESNIESEASDEQNYPISERPNDQLRPPISTNNQDDEHLIVWEDELASTYHNIYAQRINYAGESLGTEFPFAQTIKWKSIPTWHIIFQPKPTWWFGSMNVHLEIMTFTVSKFVGMVLLQAR